ncbi:MAG TPA: DUF6056 family protein [Kofleriaceae bacterium]|nr:DUF6056 family protein [Kofleriaceae bacterium]
MQGGRGPRLALLGTAAALVGVHAAVGALSPLQGSDWDGVIGAHRALVGPLGDALAALAARSTPWHAVSSAAASLALVLGAFRLAARRGGDPGRWSDVLGVALVSAVIWIALPRAGAMWFQRSYAATQVTGAALVVWFLVPFRCRTALAGRAWPAVMFVAGLAAGATTRQCALAAVIGAAIWTRRTPRAERRAWMMLGLAGAVIGLVASVVRAPWVELGRVVTRFEPDLVALAPLVRAAAPLVALIGLLVLARQLRARAPDGLDVAAAPEPPAALDAGDALGWLAAWFGFGVAGLFGPRASEATLLPAAVAFAAGALPVLQWLAGTRWIRRVLIGLAIGVHAVAWSAALATYRELGAVFDARMTAIARTGVGGVATVAPYPRAQPGFWSIGEDWADLGLRTSLARAWRLAGIELAPPFRQLEHSPELELVLELDGATPDQLAAAGAPRRWPGELAPARRTFTALVARLRATTGRPVIARLRVAGLEFTARHGRPLLAAWSDGAEVTAPDPARTSIDTRAVISIAPKLAVQFGEAWVVRPQTAEPAECTAGKCSVPVERAETTALVLCNAERCLAAEAWVPHF